MSELGRPRHPPSGDSPARPAGTSSTRSVLDVLSVQSRLTSRDRTIIDWLDRHGVLTTAQLAAAFFSSPTTASHRLAKLRAMGLVDRSTTHSPPAGSDPGTGSSDHSAPASPPPDATPRHPHPGHCRHGTTG
jgi:hypothetical protein